MRWLLALLAVARCGGERRPRARQRRQRRRPDVNRPEEKWVPREDVEEENNSTGLRPNVVILLLDDAGFGDLNANREDDGLGEEHMPAMNAFARESLRLTDFHSAASTCTPSRGGLLTGRLAARYGLTRVILHDRPGAGLPHSEWTLAHLLKKTAGYATAMAGKWHLGSDKPHHPSYHGFDETLTVPYSHDMACYERWPCRYDRAVFDDAVSWAPSSVRRSFASTMHDMCKRGAAPSMGPDWKAGAGKMSAHEACPPSALSRCPSRSVGRQAVERDCGGGCKQAQERFTMIAKKAGRPGQLLSYALYWSNASCSGQQTCDAVTVEQPAAPWRLGEKLVAFSSSFVERVVGNVSFPPSEEQIQRGHSYRPFFLYYASHSPHLPYVPAPRFQRRSSPAAPFAGYLDTMREVDEHLGSVLASLEQVKNDTVVFYSSDNGPFKNGAINYRTGAMGPYVKGGKFTPYEGGHRVFGLIRWPGMITPGVSPRLTSQLDILPTVMSWVLGGKQPRNIELDGKDIGRTLFNVSERYLREDDTLLILSGQGFPATRVGKYKVWRGGGGYQGGGVVFDTEADPAELRPASLSRPMLTKIRNKASEALAVYKSSKERDPRVSQEKSVNAMTCCNPKLPDCHCAFPENGLEMIRNGPPRFIRDSQRSTANDPRCDRPISIVPLDVTIEEAGIVTEEHVATQSNDTSIYIA